MITLETIVEALKDLPDLNGEVKMEYFMNEDEFLDLPLDNFKTALKLNITVRKHFEAGKIISLPIARNKWLPAAYMEPFLKYHPMNGIMFNQKARQ